MPLVERRIQKLLQWCALNGITVSERVQVVADGDTIAVRAVKDIVENTPLATIPKHAVISTRTSRVSHLFPDTVDRQSPFVLATVLMIELNDGLLSPFYGYLQSLPEHVPIAHLWVSESIEISMLKGTPAHDLITSKGVLANALRYLHDEVTPLMHQLLEEDLDAEWDDQRLEVDYLRAYSLVSSRAFLVDAFHGLAMVPIADGFNHTMVHNVQMETDYHVCAECGSLFECGHDDFPSTDDRTLFEETESRSEIDTCDMMSARAISAGEEVFNTYSDGKPMSNSALLAEYGFVLPGNGSSSVSGERFVQIQASLSASSMNIELALSYLEYETTIGAAS
ncbi:SET domain-containing protein [Auriculariales sp. MPI-PUGE-AT-0066]|nr:SET domain-containing protein [Auriculariales sp. MPI-PUGE-AT-0066]